MIFTETSPTRSHVATDLRRKRAIIADAHSCVRELVEVALRLEGSCQVVGQTGLGMGVLEQCRAEEPEILILDPKLPDVSGVEIVRRVKEQHRDVRILIFSGSNSREITLGVLEARPHGFAHKEEPLEVFYDVLRAVVRGSRHYSEYGVRLMEPCHGNGETSKAALAPRETDVLRLLARGLSSKQIAHELKLAAKTVDHYRTTLMSKLDIHEVAGLTRYALSVGLVNAED